MVLKNVFSIIIVFFALFLGQVEANVVLSISNYNLQQQDPIPPGGMEEFQKWIEENYVLPKDAEVNAVKGKIVLSFFVEKNGTLADIKIKSDLGYGTGEAAVNLFKKSDRWVPAMRDGKPVRSFYEFPVVITFGNRRPVHSRSIESERKTAIPSAPRRAKEEAIVKEIKWGTGVREEYIKQHTVVTGSVSHWNSGLKDKIFEEVEISPQPVGGIRFFQNWIASDYQYPQEAISAGVKGSVIIEFVVEKDGSLTDFKIWRDLKYGTGDAAIKTLRKSPKWYPGFQDDKAVRVRYKLPIDLDSSSL